MISKLKQNRINHIISYLIVIAVMSVIIALPILTNCGTENCFKSKYCYKETVATLKKVATHGRSLAGEYVYEVNGKTYNEIFRSPTTNFEEIGDQIYLLYDSINPSTSYLTYRFFVPDSLEYIRGKITFYRVDEKDQLVNIILSYSINGSIIQRNQYLSIEKKQEIEKLYKENKDVVIGVVPHNVRRGFLVMDKTNRIK